MKDNSTRFINEENLNFIIKGKYLYTETEIVTVIAEFFLSNHGDEVSKNMLIKMFNATEYVDIDELCKRELVALIKKVGLSLFSSKSKFSNKDFKDLITIVQIELDKEIDKLMFQYNREEVLLNCLLFSSVMSKITLSIYATDELDKPIEPTLVNELSELLRKYEKSNIVDMRDFLSSVKKPLELCVGYLLSESCKCSSKIMTKNINMKKIIVMFYTKLYLINVKGAIPLMGEYREEFMCNEIDGLLLPMRLYKAYSNYAKDTKGEGVDYENNLTNELFREFKRKFAFKPEDLIAYLSSDDNAVVLYQLYVNNCDKKLFELDISNNTRLLKEGVDNIIKSFILNHSLLNEEELNGITVNPNTRLFRAPIIELKTTYLIPTYTLLEAFHYFQLRILNRDLFYIENERNWNELIKTKYDEYYLPSLEKRLSERQNLYKHIKINLDLSKQDGIKKELEGLKKIPHELDLCFIDNNNVLHIKDLKNYGIQHTIWDVNKTVQKLKKDIKKLENLKLFILKNRIEVENIIGCKFNDIKVGILTVNLTAYNYFDFNSHNKNIEVSSIKEFLEDI